ncbi:CBS domain-containing protein [Tardiphaga sp. OK245]|uniref:CBS domain-containing protein n=1 Tax=Tardiphaga sp. OK245 TaxID=1855306 RepID=UPI0008A7348C|nr:CBS domain-containing protein [Tardiphaga sp. OK245]SEI15024.1 CBS domain-containing protein [Tardiphaga sp. OK245]
MARIDDELSQIGAKLRNREDVSSVTTRTFLAWAGAQRRSYWNVFYIRQALKRAALRTEPDFQSAYIDSDIRFVLDEDKKLEDEQGGVTVTVPAAIAVAEVNGPVISAIPADPTYRISKLEAANKPLVSISPDATVQQAVTMMMTNDYSQLPVMTGPRDVKGIVNWSSIGARMILGKCGDHVRDVMEVHQEIRADASMFQAISIVGQFGYVLVRNAQNVVTGIVTASDLNLQFQQLAEPFLLLGEIENHIRAILDGKFSPLELETMRDPSDENRKVEAVSDLTFGEYLRILESQEHWSKVDIPLDRKTFCEKLDRVRNIRNDVMHFDPDGVPAADLNHLRGIAHFLQQLQVINSYRK